MTDLLILDANVVNLVQPGGEYQYLVGNPDLQLIPARVAREEAERAPTPLTTPRPRSADVPAPLVMNHPLRVLGDPAVVVTNPRVPRLVRLFATREYAAATTDAHAQDQLILACAVEHVERRVAEGFGGRSHFVTRDYRFATKGDRFLRAIGAPVTLLFADGPGVRTPPGVARLSATFPP